MKKILNVINKYKVTTVIAIFTIIIATLGFTQVHTKADTSPQINFSLGVDNTNDRPGQDLQYTARVTNTGTVEVDNVRVNITLSPELTYEPGTTTATKDSKTVNEDDNWINTGTNLGTLQPGQIVYLFFRTKVNDNAQIGSQLQSAIQVEADNISSSATAVNINVVSSNLTTTLQGGNFVKVANTTQSTGWRDETVGANPGEIIEYDIFITNTGNQVAKNVHFKADLPGQDQKSNVLHPKITLSADNAADVSDTVTVDVSSPTWMVYYPGHAKKFGDTGLYDCGNVGNDALNEQGGCPIPEVFYYNSENIGDVQPGASKAIQVIFKSGLVNIATPSVTPTPTPTMTPSPTPTVTPSPTPTNSPSPTSSCSTLSATTTNGTAPLTITFTGNGSDSNGSIQQYQFNFGDTSNGQNQIVTSSSNQQSHVYYNAGNYTANLIVEDSRGNWVGGGSCSLNINVSSKPTVLGATAPPVLPKTGSNDTFYLAIASIPTLLGGVYIYRKFRLI